MAVTIPTTQELTNQSLAQLEAAMGQTAPASQKSFLRVLSAVLAMFGTGVYKASAERVMQNLVQTASGEDLDRVGNEPGVECPRKLAEAARLTATLPATTDLVIPVTATFIGAPNGVRYYVSAPAVSVAGVVTLQLTAEDVGAEGNLQVGDSLTIVSPLSGAETIATVTVLVNTGAVAETDASYRPRVAYAVRTVNGGSNTADYKRWAEAVVGAKQAFPYAGKPHRLGLTSYPGDRTVYVESETGVNADGIPPQGLLDEVRAALAADPLTGIARPALGLTDSTLWVEPITRSAATVEISNFTAIAGTTASVKAAVEQALSVYFLALAPYVEGLDLPQERNDLITDLTVAGVVQSVLTAVGASATRIRFKLSTTPYLTQYRIEPGERVKLGGVLYV